MLKKHTLYTFFLLSLLFILFSCSSIIARLPKKAYPFILYPVRKIRPFEFPHPNDKATLKIARNEYELLMFGITNFTETDLEVNKIIININYDTKLNMNIFLVEYCNITTSSRWFDKPGKRGRWPDPLIPIKELEGFDNNPVSIDFFPPLKIPACENRILLCELYLGEDEYIAQSNIRFTLFTNNEQNFTLSATILPWDFTLPKTQSVRTACKLDKSTVISKHKQLSNSLFNEEKLYLDYLHLLARHKLSVLSPHNKPIPYKIEASGTLYFDWTEFDSLTGAMLDGTLFADAPPLTSFLIPKPASGLSDDKYNLFLKELVIHLEKNHWLDRMFVYLKDEPLIRDYPQIKKRISHIKEKYPQIQTLITEAYVPNLHNVVDIFCPDLVFCGDTVPFTPLFFKGRHPNMEYQLATPAFLYKSLSRKNKMAWLFTCASAQAFDYPNLFIDSPAIYSRILPWIMYKYGFSGLLYYSVNINYLRNQNPWSNQLNIASSIASANGDGNLLYPGYDKLKYIEGHIPVPSLRMKLLREGLEDFEYLMLLEKYSKKNTANMLCQKIVFNSIIWEHNDLKLQDLISRIGYMIEELMKK